MAGFRSTGLQQAPAEVSLELLRLHPDGAKKKDNDDSLPIHYTLHATKPPRR